MLATLSEDTAPEHKADRVWALQLLDKLAGQEGVERLVLFALDSDFAVATYALTRAQDASCPDVALSATQALRCLEICEALFRDAGALHFIPNGAHTSSLLHGIRARRETLCGFQPWGPPPYRMARRSHLAGEGEGVLGNPLSNG